MNIFFVDPDPAQAAKDLCDQHICKMPIELGQMLSTAHHILDPHLDHSKLYKPTHKNHPSTIWVRQHPKHYIWAFKHFYELCLEFNRRYHKVHLTQIRLAHLLNYLPESFDPDDPTWIDPPPAMPDECKLSNSIESYRFYYRSVKSKFATWKYTTQPTWYS